MTPNQDLSLSDANFNKLRNIIHKNTGITIGDGRNSLLLSRLRSRLRELDETGFGPYIQRLTREKAELQEFINRITTNKTYFYRTPRIWEHFGDVTAKKFCEDNVMRPMRIWSAASSTGEEGYTAGIVLEEVRKSKENFDYRIVGTDISSRVLKEAQDCNYAASAVTLFRKERPDLFDAYMNGDEAVGFQLNQDIRSRVSFKMQNLQKRMVSAGPFDVVFLRNVLIYFSEADQQEILRNVRSVMAPNGTLYIGESESLSRIETDFDIVEPMIYRPSAANLGNHL